MLNSVKETKSEEQYSKQNYVACFRKTLSTSDGKVSGTDYKEMREAILSDFYPTNMKTKLIDPRSSLNFPERYLDNVKYLEVELENPEFNSSQHGEELLQLYALSLIRDIKFTDYKSNTLFREIQSFFKEVPFFGKSYNGPLISQLLLTSKQVCSNPVDYMTTSDVYNEVHNGIVKAKTSLTSPRYIITLRDLSEMVHNDYPVQFYSEAAIWMMKNIPTAMINPYSSQPYKGFICFNLPFILAELNKATTLALEAAWFYKWQVHRSARPEEMAYEVNLLANESKEPYKGIPYFGIFTSPILKKVRQLQGNVLLSQCYPEGAPAHPSFPAGHATIAGACVTLLKAFFDTNTVLPSPVIPNTDGSATLPWTASALTLGSELDKLAENVAFARAVAGVHFKSDNQMGLLLGESIGLSLLEQCKVDSRIDEFDPQFQWKVTRFSGETIMI
jgi:membrane-associated phospholipid phosphatase